MSKYYKPSGKFSTLAFLFFIIIVLIISPLLGLLYAYAIWYIPFIYINFIIAGCLGLLIGLATSHGVIRLGKVRNVPLTIGLSFLAAVITLYFHWAAWVDLVINAGESYGSSRIGVTVSNIKLIQTFNLALAPDILFEIIGEINQYGTWGLRSNTVSGTFLTIIWIIEALIIIVIATFIPSTQAKIPFCEIGNAWFKEKTLPAFNYIENGADMVKHLENSNSLAFENITKTDNLEANHSIFTLYSSDHNEHYLSIANKLAKRNKKDELEFDSDDLVEYVYLNNELTQSILSKK